MSAIKRYSSVFAVVIAVLVLVICGGCGSGSSSSSSGISQAQAEAVTGEVMLAVIQAVVNTPLSAATHKGTAPNLMAALKDFHPLATSGCAPTPDGGENCNWPVSFDGTCTGGGSIAVNGDIYGTLDDTFSGFVDSSFSIIPADCSVSGSSLMISGDQSVSVSGQMNVSDSYPTSLSFTENGGISYGPSPSGSCQFNLTFSATWSGSDVSCKYSGTACGRSINGACGIAGAR